MPDYPVPEGQTIEGFFSEVSKQGLNARLAKIFDIQSSDFPEQRVVYDERLKFELGIINSMGFPGYFLIVMEFIQWAKDKDIPVGPGRGSGPDRKSTRLNSSHKPISYAVFCLKKKNTPPPTSPPLELS